MSLREALVDWTDSDVAAHTLALSIGLMDASVSFSRDAKHVYWSENPVGRSPHGTLESFVQAGFLERRDEPDIQFRWRAEFRGSWERRSVDGPSKSPCDARRWAFASFGVGVVAYAAGVIVK